MNNQKQPVNVYPEDTQRYMGKNAQRLNILAARIVAETVRTTLGPKGMDKMLVDSLGDVVITNDGVTILEEMDIEHPAAKMIVEIAKTQEEQVGDGTTTAVVIAGELLKNAEELLDQNIHPSVITRGFRLASKKAEEILKNISKPVSINDTEILKKIVITAMTGKSAENVKEKLAELIVNAIKQISEKKDDTIILDLDNIKIEKRTGGGVDDSKLIKGLVLDKEKLHPEMPDIVKDAKILLIDSALEVKEPETDAQIRITDPNQLQSFIQQEERMLKDMADKIIESKANVVFCQKGVDDLVQHYLAKAGILAYRRVKKSDMEKLAKATDAKIISNLEDLNENDLGYAGIVKTEKISGEEMVFIEECKNPKAVTILIRGGTEHVIDEVERAVKDALGDLSSVMKYKSIVAGGGAPEVEVAKKLNEYAESLSGREQLAVKAFAKSLEIIPKTLSENAGIDPIDILVELKAEHDKGKTWAGIDVFDGKVKDMWKEGVLEPLEVKTQAIKSATEVSNMILRIDDVIAAGKLNKDETNSKFNPNM